MRNKPARNAAMAPRFDRTAQDVANLLPTLKVFGSPRPHRGGNEATE